LVALHWVDTRRAVLRPADVEAAGGQLDLRPLQIAQLGRPQAVAIADQDHGCVPMAVAAGLPGGRHQALDLGRRQVLASANLGIYSGWCRCVFPRYLARVRTQLANYHTFLP